MRVTLLKESFSDDPQYHLQEAHLNLPHDSLAAAVIPVFCVYWQLSLSSSHNVVPFFSPTGKFEFGFGSPWLRVLSGGGGGGGGSGL